MVQGISEVARERAQPAVLGLGERREEGYRARTVAEEKLLPGNGGVGGVVGAVGGSREDGGGCRTWEEGHGCGEVAAEGECSAV